MEDLSDSSHSSFDTACSINPSRLSRTLQQGRHASKEWIKLGVSQKRPEKLLGKLSSLQKMGLPCLALFPRPMMKHKSLSKTVRELRYTKRCKGTFSLWMGPTEFSFCRTRIVGVLVHFLKSRQWTQLVNLHESFLQTGKWKSQQAKKSNGQIAPEELPTSQVKTKCAPVLDEGVKGPCSLNNNGFLILIITISRIITFLKDARKANNSPLPHKLVRSVRQK